MEYYCRATQELLEIMEGTKTYFARSPRVIGLERAESSYLLGTGKK